MIRRTVRLVAPFFDDFHLRPQALNEDKIRIEWLHKGSEAYFDAASLSDGSLRFIALATLLLQPVSHRPSVILLDEPELGLHPRAISALASLVKQASVETQIILSTQSPLLLDHCPAGRRTRRREDERRHGADQTRRSGPRQVAAGLQPRPALGEERARRPPCPGGSRRRTPDIDPGAVTVADPAGSNGTKPLFSPHPLRWLGRLRFRTAKSPSDRASGRRSKGTGRGGALH